RLDDLRVQFETEIERLEQSVSELTTDSEFGVSNHLADEATDIYEREKDLALIEDRRALIAEVDAALERVADGTYGICAATGKPIPEERLEALPYAALSVEAQAAQGARS
ncbi:MAG TPA: TraR/DksA C4-type zinc finger protein, partial [Herpetosiphonaceae bacterium]